MIHRLKTLGLQLRGYKKVMLKDSKGVLNSSNNYKWVKETKDSFTTILSTGTKIDARKDGTYKAVMKKDGTGVFFAAPGTIGENEIIRTLKRIKNKWVKERSLRIRTQKQITETKLKEQSQRIHEQTSQKRAEFIRNFKEKYERITKRSEDGSVSKGIFDKKTGKLVAWFRKDGKTGNYSRGSITHYEGNIGKEVHAETGTKKIYKHYIKTPGQTHYRKVDIPNGDLTNATVKEVVTKKETNSSEIREFYNDLIKTLENQ